MGPLTRGARASLEAAGKPLPDASSSSDEHEGPRSERKTKAPVVQAEEEERRPRGSHARARASRRRAAKRYQFVVAVEATAERRRGVRRAALPRRGTPAQRARDVARAAGHEPQPLDRSGAPKDDLYNIPKSTVGY